VVAAAADAAVAADSVTDTNFKIRIKNEKGISKNWCLFYFAMLLDERYVLVYH
jgi:hypothetical protein